MGLPAFLSFVVAVVVDVAVSGRVLCRGWTGRGPAIVRSVVVGAAWRLTDEEALPPQAAIPSPPVSARIPTTSTPPGRLDRGLKGTPRHWSWPSSHHPSVPKRLVAYQDYVDQRLAVHQLGLAPGATTPKSLVCTKVSGNAAGKVTISDLPVADKTTYASASAPKGAALATGGTIT